jgi:hypothetical protein
VSAQWVVIGPLLVAGLGGGMVTSPNVTLTLENVPVRMAGAAGGALQTLQRIGAAIGTATLAAIFYHVLNQTGHDYQAAVSDALFGTCAFMLLSLLIALGEVIWRRLHVGAGLAARPDKQSTYEPVDAGRDRRRPRGLQWHGVSLWILSRSNKLSGSSFGARGLCRDSAWWWLEQLRAGTPSPVRRPTDALDVCVGLVDYLAQGGETRLASSRP